jgi:hypothetical protein
VHFSDAVLILNVIPSNHIVITALV